MKMLLTLDGLIDNEKMRKIFRRITSLRVYKSKLIKKNYQKNNWIII